MNKPDLIVTARPDAAARAWPGVPAVSPDSGRGRLYAAVGGAENGLTWLAPTCIAIRPFKPPEPAPRPARPVAADNLDDEGSWAKVQTVTFLDDNPPTRPAAVPHPAAPRPAAPPHASAPRPPRRAQTDTPAIDPALSRLMAREGASGGGATNVGAPHSEGKENEAPRTPATAAAGQPDTGPEPGTLAAAFERANLLITARMAQKGEREHVH